MGLAWGRASLWSRRLPPWLAYEPREPGTLLLLAPSMSQLLATSGAPGHTIHADKWTETLRCSGSHRYTQIKAMRTVCCYKRLPQGVRLMRCNYHC